ncbi:RYamide receptor-like [Porites lutea]|uniref:RYamide receptor-like n=1 Tax=Porites lutea TaxID=51062 RepID=UPI003CC5D51B
MNSTTGNGSIESSSCFSTTAYKIGGTIALSLIIAVSLMANSFIVLIVYKTPTLRKPINYFIANMAMSDLLYSLFLPPRNLSLLHTNQSWLIGGQFGQALCKLVPFFDGVSSIVSIQNLVLITVDRFVAVVFPLRSPLIRSKLCPFFILGTWIVAAAVVSPLLFTFQLVEYSGEMRCDTRWKKAFGESSSVTDYLLAGSILFRYIPVMLLIILYSIIIIKLKTQKHPGERSANTQQQRNRRNRNVLQLSIAIVLVFVFCWLPFTTSVLIMRYRGSSIHSVSCGFWLYYCVSYYMGVGYCAINPIICFVFSSNYREGLKRLMNCS